MLPSEVEGETEPTAPAITWNDGGYRRACGLPARPDAESSDGTRRYTVEVSDVAASASSTYRLPSCPTAIDSWFASPSIGEEGRRYDVAEPLAGLRIRETVGDWGVGGSVDGGLRRKAASVVDMKADGLS